MSQKDTQTEKKLALIKDVFQNIKNDRVTWEPVIKAAEVYSKALKTLSIASRQFYDTLGKVGEQAAHANGGTNDLGVGIQTMCEHFKQLEKKRDEMSRSLIEDLATPLDKSLDTWKKEALNLEKDYQKDSKKLSSEIKDAEKESQKAGKKGQTELKRAIETLNGKVKEMETLRQTTLRNGIIEERKRYCFFIMHFATVIGHEMNLHDQAVNQIKTQLPHWTQLAVSPEQLPPEIQQLVEVQQRTFVSIQSEGSFSLNVSSYYDDSEYDIPRTTSFSSNYGSNTYDIPKVPPPTSNSYVDDVIRVGDQVKALYSYSGDSEKLSFREGDIISVNEVDPSGWCLGEIYGSSGWFPSNYVEKIKKPAAFSPPPQAVYSPPPPPQAVYSPPPPPAQTSYAPPPAPKVAQSSYAPPPPPKQSGGGGGPPPPPPPSGGGAPPPPAPPPVSSGGGDRGALLSSIQGGARLKKTVTNDRSSPKLSMK